MTPTFLIDKPIERGVGSFALADMPANDNLLSTFDVDRMAPDALLFQTGYLTMKPVETDPGGRPRYRLGYPNHEVRQTAP